MTCFAPGVAPLADGPPLVLDQSDDLGVLAGEELADLVQIQGVRRDLLAGDGPQEGPAPRVALGQELDRPGLELGLHVRVMRQHDLGHARVVELPERGEDLAPEVGGMGLRSPERPGDRVEDRVILRADQGLEGLQPPGLGMLGRVEAFARGREARRVLPRGGQQRGVQVQRPLGAPREDLAHDRPEPLAQSREPRAGDLAGLDPSRERRQGVPGRRGPTRVIPLDQEPEQIGQGLRVGVRAGEQALEGPGQDPRPVGRLLRVGARGEPHERAALLFEQRVEVLPDDPAG